MAESYYRGERICQLPATPGIYAWYYKPLVSHWPAVSEQLRRLLHAAVTIETRATLRYGLVATGKAIGRIQYTSDAASIDELLEELTSSERETVTSFLAADLGTTFSRPIYVGMASNLNDRVHGQHYQQLVDLWDDASAVTRYLRTNPVATVDDTMTALSMPHSFALEARVRLIAPRDLAVYILPLRPDDVASSDEETQRLTRRRLERIVHLLADPVFGKR